MKAIGIKSFLIGILAGLLLGCASPTLTDAELNEAYANKAREALDERRRHITEVKAIKPKHTRMVTLQNLNILSYCPIRIPLTK